MKLTDRITLPENYDGMTAEELKSFISNLEMPEEKIDTSSSDEISRLKGIISKANAEASEYKKKWQATLSDAERAEAERQQRDQEREARIAELEKREAVNGYKANFLAAGYSAELAESSAQAMADGNNQKVFEDINAFIRAKTEQLQAEALNNQPKVSTGNPVNPGAEDDPFMAAVRKGMGL